MRDYTFSVILYVDEKEKFAHALSCLNQAAGDEKIQLIVADPFADPKIAAAACDFKGGFAAYFELPDMQMAEAYQTGLAYVKGDYVNFSLASSYFSTDIFSNISRAFDKYQVNMVSASPWFSGMEEVPYAGAFQAEMEETQVKLTEPDQAYHIQILLQAYFFRRKALEGMVFQRSSYEDAGYQFLLTLQLRDPNYVLLRDVKYYYTVPLEDNEESNAMQYQSRWYEESVSGFLLPFLKKAKEEYGKIPVFLQVACDYLICTKFLCNWQGKNKEVLKTAEEKDQFYHAVFEALTFLDNAVICDKSFINTNRSLRMFLLRGKAKALGTEVEIQVKENDFLAVLKSDEKDAGFLEKTSKESMKIQVIDYAEELLHVDAYIDLPELFEKEKCEIYACCLQNGEVTEKIEPVYTQIYPMIKCFGDTITNRVPVTFLLPLKTKDGLRKTYRFYYSHNGGMYQFKLTFNRYSARIARRGKDAYWIFQKGWMLRPGSGRTELVAEKCGFILHLKKEIRFCQSLAKMDATKMAARQGIAMRLIYWILLPFYRGKEIWVTSDKLYKAGDNGEYMFQYMREHHPEIDMYYVIRKDSPDYARLKKQHGRHILVFNSMRCKILYLFSKIVLGTHASEFNRFCGDPALLMYVTDLHLGELICIQHGLSIQQIAKFQNRIYADTKLYCCASPVEVENLSQPIYGYSADQLKLTGLARYDGLIDRGQKMILITPTWRKNVVNSGETNVKKSYNENFKKSDYFRIYNALVNDEKLIRCAKEHGYRIVYLLHPAISPQIDDFTHANGVEFVEGSDVDYEDILCEASLMVTDYSGIQYDFAYMRKPILYFHPDKLPPHYEEGGLNYETMGFGPIFNEQEPLVEAICRAIENDCEMEDKYRKRADAFFAFDDHQNCERIFEAIKEYQG